MKYVAAGNVMSDMVAQKDGTKSSIHIGGPAFFALSGIRLWEKDVALLSNVGADFYDYYGQWFDDNNMTRELVTIKAEHTTMHELSYNPDGSYNHHSVFGSENLGYLKITPKDLMDKMEGVKGFYLAQNTDTVFWEGIKKAKEKHGFTMMWEMEAGDCIPENVVRSTDFAKIAGAWSLNGNEASKMFGIPRENEEDMINEIIKMGAEFCFFRVGSKGSYVIMGNNAYFNPSFDLVPPVDPTGCGNCSTGTAMWAFCEGYDPVSIGLISNISAAYNVQQFGPYPKYDDKDMADAKALLTKLKVEYGEK